MPDHCGYFMLKLYLIAEAALFRSVIKRPLCVSGMLFQPRIVHLLVG